MKIGMLGTGDVGKALGKGFIALGHEVKMGSRTATNEKALAWAKEMGSKASAGTFADAASFGDVIVLATLGISNEDVLKSASPEKLRGKIIIDATNPLDFSTGAPKLAIAGNDSGGERVQKLVPDAHVVKAFNTVGNISMFKPSFPGGPPDMFICGNDEEAKKKSVESCPTSVGASSIPGGSSRRVTSRGCAWSGSSPACGATTGTGPSSS